MVRLLPRRKRIQSAALRQFQSHNGAIAAQVKAPARFFRLRFQSHNGAIAAFDVDVKSKDVISVSIPQWCDCCHFKHLLLKICPLGFNPTMVRLLQPKAKACLKACPSFNPTMVRLLHVVKETRELLERSFNPTMVRLLLSCSSSRSICDLSVSIPQWCDCCRCRVGGLQRIFEVSIPQWCDCCQGKILGFEGKMGQNERGVAVDLRLPEEPKGVDGK